MQARRSWLAAQSLRTMAIGVSLRAPYAYGISNL